MSMSLATHALGQALHNGRDISSHNLCPGPAAAAGRWTHPHQHKAVMMHDVTQQSPYPDEGAQGLLTRTVHVSRPSAVTLAAASTLALARHLHHDCCPPCHLRHSSHAMMGVNSQCCWVAFEGLCEEDVMLGLCVGRSAERPSLCHEASVHHGSATAPQGPAHVGMPTAACHEPTLQPLLNLKAGYVMGQGTVNSSKVHLHTWVQQV